MREYVPGLVAGLERKNGWTLAERAGEVTPDGMQGLARRQPGPGHKRGTGTSDPGMIGYTLPEIRRLLISLIQARAPDPGRVWSWSAWRRRRQYQARLCHYRRRGYQLI